MLRGVVVGKPAKTRERRTVLAGSAFLALVDVFVVSIVWKCIGTSMGGHRDTTATLA